MSLHKENIADKILACLCLLRKHFFLCAPYAYEIYFCGKREAYTFKTTIFLFKKYFFE